MPVGTEEDAPAKLGRYHIVAPIAVGDVSSVFVACPDEGPVRPVMIERLSPTIARSKSAETFLDVARPALALSHPNIAQVRELVSDGSETFVVLEHLEGETLAMLVRRLEVESKPLSFALCAYVGTEAAHALEAAHERGVHHEHLTPNDILIGYDGTVKVLGLGIASAFDAIVEAGSIHERDLPYASPERCKDEAIDRRTDLFSLGAVLWELMTRRSPFQRGTAADTLRAILTEGPRSATTGVPALPEELADILTRAMAREPSERWETAQLFASALGAFAKGVQNDEEPASALREIMQRLFEKRIRHRARLLRRFESTRVVTPATPIEIPVAARPSDAAPPLVSEPPTPEDSSPWSAVPLPKPFWADAIEADRASAPAADAPSAPAVDPSPAPSPVSASVPAPASAPAPASPSASASASGASRRRALVIGAIALVLALGVAFRLGARTRSDGSVPSASAEPSSPVVASQSAPLPVPSPSAAPDLSATAPAVLSAAPSASVAPWVPPSVVPTFVVPSTTMAVPSAAPSVVVAPVIDAAPAASGAPVPSTPPSVVPTASPSLEPSATPYHRFD
jgi:serine/threonine protein kinase